MPPYSEDLVRERSPFWFPRRPLAIYGSGSSDDPYIIPSSPTIVCPAPPSNSPLTLANHSYAINAWLFAKQFKEKLKLGSQEGSIN